MIRRKVRFRPKFIEQTINSGRTRKGCVWLTKQKQTNAVSTKEYILPNKPKN